MTVTPDSDPLNDFPTDLDIDAVIYEAKGDMREAIRNLLHDLAVLAEDANATTSVGYVRGRLRVVRRIEG